MVKKTNTRVQITFPNDVLSKIDSFACKHNLNRSSACLYLVSDSLATQQVVDSIPNDKLVDLLTLFGESLKEVNK